MLTYWDKRDGWASDRMLAELEAARNLEGSILDGEGTEVRLTMQHITPFIRTLAHLIDEPPGPNRAQRRAALAKARRRA